MKNTSSIFQAISNFSIKDSRCTGFAYQSFRPADPAIFSWLSGSQIFQIWCIKNSYILDQMEKSGKYVVVDSLISEYHDWPLRHSLSVWLSAKSNKRWRSLCLQWQWASFSQLTAHQELPKKPLSPNTFSSDFAWSEQATGLGLLSSAYSAEHKGQRWEPKSIFLSCQCNWCPVLFLNFKTWNIFPV